MEKIIDLWFPLLFLFAFVWVAVGMGWMMWHHHKHGLKPPRPGSPDIRFRQTMVSGRALKNLGPTASSCLTITVTATDLWISAFPPFNALLAKMGMEQRIPLGLIRRADANCGTVELEFVRPDGAAVAMRFHLRNMPEFLQSIGCRGTKRSR